MRAIVLGGAGGMGQGVARDLIKQGTVTDVVIGDLYPDPERLAPKLRDSEKVTLVKMDVNDHQGMVDAFRKADVVINCAGPFYKTAVPVARAAVEAQVNYIDICDDYEGTEILFNSEIDEMAKKAGITVLTGMGSDPGTNNVLVKWYADRLDRVDDIYLYWVVSIAELAGAAWDHSLHMTLGKVPQFIDGELVHVEGGTGEVAEEFLEPLGTCHVRYVGHPQPMTLPRYIKGVRNVIIKGALIPLWVDELIKEQKETGFLDTEPVNVKGTEVVPYDLALKLWETIPQGRDNGPQSSGLKVIVKGEKDGEKVVYTADMVGRMAPGTGLPASIASLMMDAGDVTVKGVVAPEGCIDPDRFLGAFLKRGARIHQTRKISSMFKPEL
ncbi:MAG: SDR family NAD(P)-dependent oxidoreductase [Deltaproteobacteria bacterium]|nr:SDR family NAD(P)-dependent oxidoreductase [Deltaproteobacteria bacterium]MBW2048262.1 SDR family NAD(P)-dependent oxidoreductase [Deltaproteobacteria bacterium]MBW2110008.1 SDR family NAD(P)-dependent oxidoreductase [Deltaproteobacteria bacterium]MBW2351791.1 SDR family NAD(P)-dependent oxidoreductase [Deltaproteobacteria bacterium]HDZ90413.1 SDR family NAD(P)-dependent oxidoreductase [Deltaproteobacteria bacterium]